ncbi:MAG: PIN domain-containing protein [Acidimicrobiales bacterium]
MTLLDTSVTVPALLSWHEYHQVALEAAGGCRRLASHVALETYAVITRLPGSHRVPGQDVVAMLAHNFPDEPVSLPADHCFELLATLSRAGLVGGAAYDALIGSVACHTGETLVTMDRRALPAYQAVGARVEVIGAR